METVYVPECYNCCPFCTFDSLGVKCGHPHLKDEPEPYTRFINEFNSMDGNIPKECPLRNESVIIITEIKLEEM